MKITTQKIMATPVVDFPSSEMAAEANGDPERYALRLLVREFAAKVESKLLAVYDANRRSGWDKKAGWCASSDHEVIKAIRRHVTKATHDGDPVDVAAFAAFWWNSLEDDA